MRRPVLWCTAVAILFTGFPSAAAAHEAAVGICIPAYRGGPCYEPAPETSYEGEGGPSYYYGDVVAIKGRVTPHHRGEVEILRRKAPDYELRRLAPDVPFPLWETVATVPIDERGRYRHLWRTTRRDADQERPYQFGARVSDHGESRIHEVYVLFGE